MDIQTVRGLGTILVFVAFIGVVLWAYSSKRKGSFDEANLPLRRRQASEHQER